MAHDQIRRQIRSFTSGYRNVFSDVCNYFPDNYNVEETIEWLKNEEVRDLSFEKLLSYLELGNPTCIQTKIDDFCDKEIYDSICREKCLFDEFDQENIAISRGKANLYERIKSLFFMNRAALKLANIDAITNFMFTNIEQNVHHNHSKGPFYFADVCAGPGGFTEYILWRKSWLFKGFGFTLKDDHDFKLYESHCTSPFSFQAFYGSRGDGNICCPDNIDDFKTKILFQTKQEGVHFMTSDGGFSVEGNESLQEVLSKNIYLCQCLVALEIVRTHGHFVTKMFDVFTKFSVGLIYLMYRCFKKVAIVKPNASRPANGERYLICYDLQKNEEMVNVRHYLRFVANKLWELKNKEEEDVLELVPMATIKGDSEFYNFILNSNNQIGKGQIEALKRLRLFCEKPNLKDPRQSVCRKRCLDYWQLPDKIRIDYDEENRNKIALMKEYFEKTDWFKRPPLSIDENFLRKFDNEREEWSFCALYSSREKNKCNIYAGMGSKSYRWQDNSWVKEKNLKLSPGTILYGEIVKETLKLDSMDEDTESYRHCLHIIDALYLGDLCLTELPFSERMDWISIYAESLNHEFEEKRIRIRKKPIHRLSLKSFCTTIQKGPDDLTYRHILPTLGFRIKEEFHRINSILFLKTQSLYGDVPLQLMFGLHAQLFLDDSNIELLNILTKKLA